jgi:hypothetical protein
VLRSSGAAYSRAELVRQAEQLLKQPADDVRAVGPTAFLAGPDSLRRCVDALELPGATLLAADLGTFEGKPAAVLVLQGADGRREAWVVSPDCRPGADGTQFFTRLP